MHCSVCGEDHPAESMELSYRRPDEIAELSREQRAERVHETADVSILDGERVFVRAVLPLPVESRALPYHIGLWVEVSRASFERIDALWDEPSQASEPPFDARLANDLPFMASTLGTPAKLQLTGPTSRPSVLVSSLHQVLHDAQANGITSHRASEYSACFA